MNDLIIPKKCEGCGNRKPIKVIFETGIDRGFNRQFIGKFICEECDALHVEGETDGN